MSEVRIKINENGPLTVTGPAELLDADGTPVEVAEGRAFFLCRCGGSTNKPFCDGTHSKIGFEGALKAVAEADGA